MASSKEVALRAGVSRSTVSQILNGHGHRFSPGTVTKVKSIAEGMGYRPSAAARTLARGTSDLVITLIPNITLGPRLREFLDVFASELEREGYTNLLRVATTADSLGDTILDLRPHALVSLAPLDRDDRDRLERHGVLVVEQPRVLQEHLDVAIGGRQAEHLSSRGYDTVVAAVPVDMREHRFASPRAAGAHQWGLRNGLRVLPTLHVDLARRGAVEPVRGLPPVTVGVAAYNDEVALAIIGAARILGRKIPETIGVVGVDNSVLAHIAVPTMTTIDFDLEFSAREMLRVIVGRSPDLEEAATAEVESRLRIVEGDSTARVS